MKFRLFWLPILLSGLVLAIASTAPLPSYALKGTVISVESDDRLLLIEHEEIPGFMPPMTMYFRVDAATHRAARAGDRIEATMVRHPESLVLQNARLTPSTAAALGASPGRNCGCDCCKDRPKGVACCCHESEPAATPSKAAPSIERHPLKGVVTAVLPERSALMVKHEEIPGVMRAMTMLFKVDTTTVKAAQKGQALTGLMSRQGSDWVLENVKFVADK